MKRKNQCKYLSFNFSNSAKILERVKSYIKKYDCPEITLDLSSLNIFEASKVMVVSSVYHSQNIINFIAGLPVKNLEIV